MHTPHALIINAGIRSINAAQITSLACDVPYTLVTALMPQVCDSSQRIQSVICKIEDALTQADLKADYVHLVVDEAASLWVMGALIGYVTGLVDPNKLDVTTMDYKGVVTRTDFGSWQRSGERFRQELEAEELQTS